MLNPGKFNKKIQIIAPEPIDRDGDGFKTETNAVILNAWAQVKTTSGMTLIKNNTDFDKAYVRFNIRFPKEQIKRGMLIRYDDNIYRIEYVNNIDEESTEVELQTVKVVK